MTLLLSTDDTQRVVSTKEGIDVLEGAYQALAEKEAAVRLRSDLIVPLREDEAYNLATMEGAIRPLGVAAIVLRSDFNRTVIRHGTKSHEKWAREPGQFCGLTVLYSIATAEPLAIIAHGHLQVMRVGASSALAARYLARPDSSICGIIGTGWQAQGHARAFAAAFPLKQIKVYSRGVEARQEFCRTMSDELELDVVPVDRAEDAVVGSDIVGACTNSRTPVVREEWFSDGMFLSSVRGSREVGVGAMEHADVYGVHSLEFGPMNVVGEPEHPDRYPGVPGRMEFPDKAVSLAQIVSDPRHQRTEARQLTYFNNNRGLGIQFTALGKVAYDRAVEQGIGRELPTEWFLMDIST
jgi:alanine dehydrogenase